MLIDESSLQAGESSQMPPSTFPGSLASYVLVFAMDAEWHNGELYAKREKGKKASSDDVRPNESAQ